MKPGDDGYVHFWWEYGTACESYVSIRKRRRLTGKVVSSSLNRHVTCPDCRSVMGWDRSAKT